MSEFIPNFFRKPGNADIFIRFKYEDKLDITINYNNFLFSLIWGSFIQKNPARNFQSIFIRSRIKIKRRTDFKHFMKRSIHPCFIIKYLPLLFS